MNGDDPYRTLLGGYTLNILDQDECKVLDQHLLTCPECQAELADLDTVAIDLMPDVRPRSDAAPDPWRPSELLLPRLLRQVRRERWRQTRARALGVAAAAVLVIGGATGGGLALGRTVVPATHRAGTPAGVRTVAATDSLTHAHITAKLTADVAGFTRVDVMLTGEPSGGVCVLQAIDDHDDVSVVSSWRTPEAGTGPEGTHITGSVSVPLQHLRGLRVRNLVTSSPVVAVRTS